MKVSDSPECVPGEFLAARFGQARVCSGSRSRLTYHKMHSEAGRVSNSSKPMTENSCERDQGTYLAVVVVVVAGSSGAEEEEFFWSPTGARAI
jgi:hypothetical protein